MTLYSSRAITTAENFTTKQIDVVVALERVGGSLSLISVSLIFLAYGLVRRVRNVQNTFILFASISNVGASIGSVIALDGLKQGEGSTLCQTQGFLFQMFMQSDPWWSLAMAINVFFVFYFRTSPDSFRRWWWLYCVICYGGPFVIALVLLLLRNPRKGLVYGDATIWCWIDGNWNGARIYAYYLLIWICIIGSLICYILVGYHVFRSRNRLRSFSVTKSHEAGQNERVATNVYGNLDGFYGTVTTEVRIVHTPASQLEAPQRVHMGGHEIHNNNEERTAPGMRFCSSTVSAAPRRHRYNSSALNRLATTTSSVAVKFVVDDPIKRAYLRTSLLFAISVLVTWIPSSLNRIHSWLVGTSPYEFQVATAAVLPLQGVWNGIIFFLTSWNAVRDHALVAFGRTPGGGLMEVDDGTAAAGASDGRARNARPSTDFADEDSATLGSDVELRRIDFPERKTST